MRVLYDYIH